MTTADVLQNAALCGPLDRKRWTKLSVVRLCRKVFRSYAPELADESWTDSDRQTPSSNAESDLVFELEDVLEIEATGRGLDRTLRTISPGLNAARRSNCYFVRPDWIEIERADPAYEQTLMKRRADGQILFFVERGKTLSQGCEFIVTDPKWLLSQFFIYGDRANYEKSTPYLWLQKRHHVTDFWRKLRFDAASATQEQIEWEGECVMSLLLHCGVAMHVTTSNRYNIVFPRRLFCDSAEMPDEILPHRGDLLDEQSFQTETEREAASHRLAIFLCAMADPALMRENSYRVRFFKKHAVVVNHSETSALIVDFFTEPKCICFYKDFEFATCERLLLSLRALASQPSIHHNGIFGSRTKDCCLDTCALCTFSDVVRTLFLCRDDDVLISDVRKSELIESVFYAKETGICKWPVQHSRQTQ